LGLAAALGTAVLAMIGVRVMQRPQRIEPISSMATASSSTPSASSSAATEPPPALVRVRLETKPSGAHAIVGNEDRGETPLDMLLPRASAPLVLELSHSGYETLHDVLVPDRDQTSILLLRPIEPRRYVSGRSPSVAPTLKAPDCRPPFITAPNGRRVYKTECLSNDR
jgi:hypothetical protein